MTPPTSELTLASTAIALFSPLGWNDVATTPAPYILFTLHCLIGIGAAIAARRKGLDGKRWLVLGLIGGTVALVAVWFKPAQP